MLLQLRDYLVKEQVASLEQIARFFQVDTTALEPMLDVWISRGVIHQEVKKVACGTACTGCDYPPAIYYCYLKITECL